MRPDEVHEAIQEAMFTACGDCGHVCDQDTMVRYCPAYREAVIDALNEYQPKTKHDYPAGFPVAEHEANGCRGVPKGWHMNLTTRVFVRDTLAYSLRHFWKYTVKGKAERLYWFWIDQPIGKVKHWWFERKGIEYCEHCWDFDGKIHRADDGRHE